MTRPSQKADGAPGPDARAQPDSSPESEAVQELRAMLRGLSAIGRDYLELLAVEGRLAGRSLVAMVLLGVVLALLLVSSWFFVAAATGLWFVQTGVLDPPLALLATAGVNILLACLVWLAIRRISRNLEFRGIIESLGRLLPGEGEGTA